MQCDSSEMTFECPCKGRVSVIFLKHELHNINNVHFYVVICIVFVIDWRGNASNLKCTQFHGLSLHNNLIIEEETYPSSPVWSLTKTRYS